MDAAQSVPTPSFEDSIFWGATKEHRLVLPHCRACNHVWFPPYAACPRCFSQDLDWLDAVGRGSLFGWTEIHARPSASYPDSGRYIVALVELAEGPLMLSRLIALEWDELHLGLPLEVVFDDITPDVTIPRFRPYTD
jgi:uncharacterized OB-fold protein